MWLMMNAKSIRERARKDKTEMGWRIPRLNWVTLIWAFGSASQPGELVHVSTGDNRAPLVLSFSTHRDCQQQRGK